MGTSLFKTAALLGILSVPVTPAWCADAVGLNPATGNNPALTGQALANQTLANQTLANRSLANRSLANQGIANGGLVGGLSPSQQDFLMNFASPTSAGGPAEQMQSKAQANAESAIRSSAAASGMVTGSGVASPGASGNGAPLAITSPAVSAPVVNNPGTLAETLQPATAP